MNSPSNCRAFIVSIHARRPYVVEEHAHSWCEILCLSAGRIDVFSSGRSWHARPGDLICYQPGVRHSESVAVGPLRYCCLRFAVPDHAPIAFPEDLPVVTTLDDGGAVQRLTERMALEDQHHDRWTTAIRSAMVNELVGRIGRAWEASLAALPAARPNRQQALEAFLQTLDQGGGAGQRQQWQFEQDPADHRLAQTLRDALGTTPKQYQIQARIARARTLLRDTDRTIASIADELGYTSPQFFARQFRKLIGHSPSGERRLRAQDSQTASNRSDVESEEEA